MLATALALSVSAADMKLVEHAWGVTSYPALAQLKQTSDNTYSTAVAISQYATVMIEYDGEIYSPSDWQPEFAQDKVYSFAKANNGSYVQFPEAWSGVCKVTVEADGGLSVKFTQGVALEMMIDTRTVRLTEDVEGLSGDVSYNGLVTVNGSPVEVLVKAGETTYGAATQPEFGTSDEEQTQSVALAAGAEAVRLTIGGKYALTVTLDNGVPATLRVVKSEVVADFSIDGTELLFDSADRTYKGQANLRRNTAPSINYGGKTLYAQTDIAGSLEVPSGSVALATTDRGSLVQSTGTYSLCFDPATQMLDYTNLTPPQPSTLSATVPDAMTYCENTSSYTPDHPYTLWFNTEDDGKVDVGDFGAYKKVFLLGNGRLGMAIYGGRNEEILINDKTNHNSQHDPGYESVPNGNGGNYAEIGYLKVTDKGEAPSWGGPFLRQLDLTKAVATAVNLEGTRTQAREYLVSRPAGVGVMHYTAESERTLSYEYSFSGGGTADAEGRVLYAGTTTDGCVNFAFGLRVVSPDGSVNAGSSSITVADAREILVVYAVATDYDQSCPDFRNGKSGDELKAEVAARLDAAVAKGWTALYDEHLAEYEPLFGSAYFELDDADYSHPTDELKAAYTTASSAGGSRAVEMLLFAHGRYLNLASSRGDDVALPSNLQGIWGTTASPWGCDFHTNINLQMNYWGTESTNIPAAHEPFMRYLKLMSQTHWDDYARKLVPDTKGWTCFLLNSPDGYSFKYNGDYVEAAGWNCYHIWQHYLYSQDRAFLEEYYPVIYGAARFYMDYARDTDGDGRLELPCNYSPELSGGTTVATHAQQILATTLTYTRDAARILGKEADAAELDEFLSKIYDGLEAKDGEQCEWKGQLTSEKEHRHLSHLMQLFPFGGVSPYDEDRANFEANVAALHTRGDGDGSEDAGWNTSWKMNCYARALDGDEALRQLAVGMPERISSDLRTTCKHTFQIDGTGGWPSAIAEMLMQSYTGVIDILPAVPSAWGSGRVSGLKAAGNYTVDIEWANGKITEVTISDPLSGSRADGPMRVRLHESSVGAQEIYVNGTRAEEDLSDLFRAPSRAPQTAAAYTSEPRTSSMLLTIPSAGATTRITIGTEGSTGVTAPGAELEFDPAAAYELYDLTGRRIDPSAVCGGIYIRRQGPLVEKVKL